jgi:hypothetical protein
MVDACAVVRPGGPYTDSVSGLVVVGSVPVYEGPCKVQQTIAQSSSPSAAGHQFTVQNTRLDLPVGAGPLLVGDSVTITASVLDEQLVGRVFRVVELFHKSFATAQRVRVEEVTA